MKKTVKFLVYSVILILLSCNTSANLEEITADNYTEKLKFAEEITIPPSLAGVDKFLPYELSFTNDYNFTPTNNERYSVSNSRSPDGGETTDIGDHSSGIRILLIYNPKKILTFIQIIFAFSDPERQLKAKNILKKIIIDEGYVLKKTNLKNGKDIIIRPFDKKKYIIGWIAGDIDDECVGITFNMYKKPFF